MINSRWMGALAALAFAGAAGTASADLTLRASHQFPGGSMRPFCEPPTVTSTPHSSWR